MLELNWNNIDADKFEDLCGDIIRFCLPQERRGTYVRTSMKYRRDFQVDGIIEIGGLPYLGIESPVLFSYKSADPKYDVATASKQIVQAFIGGNRLDRLASRAPKSVALFTNHDLTPEAKERIRKEVKGRFSICFQGRTELGQCLREYPHLLWKYFNQSWLLETYHSSEISELREVLLGDPIADCIPLDIPKHPAIENLDVQRGTHFRITGKPGAGKSVALWQILSTLPETEVVFLASMDTHQIWSHLREILLKPRPRFAVVVDNLHDRLLASQGPGVLADLCGLAGKLGPDVHVFVSYRTTNRRQVEALIGPETWRKWGFRELALDDPPQDFIARTVSLTCQTLNIQSSENALREFTEGVIEWENTPACVVSSLYPYKNSYILEGSFPVHLKDRESRWRESFKELVLANRSSEIDVLRSVSALRESGIKRNPYDTVFDVFTQVADRGEGEFEQAVQNLHAEGWLRYKDGFISGHDIQVTAEVVDLVLEGKPVGWLEKYRHLLEEGKFTKLMPQQVRCLCSLSRLYWNCGNTNAVLQMNNKVLLAEPGNVQALCNCGLCQVRIGRRKAGIANLRAAVDLAPEELGPFEQLYFTLMGLNRKYDAQCLLDERVKRSSVSPEVLRFASFAYSAIGSKEQYLVCARRFWKLKRDAMSAALFADAIRFSRHSERATKFLRAAISRWPENGYLHLIASEHCRMAGKKEESVEHAQAAVRMSPNNADAHSVLAWALLGENRLQDAELAIAKAKIIIPKDPVIVALDGMIHAEKHETDQALAALNIAIENRERIPEGILSNAYLALGDSLIRSDKVKESNRAYALAHKHGVPLSFCTVHKAEALKTARRYEDAIRVFKRASRSKDMASRALRGLGEVFAEIGDHRRAVNVFLKVCRLYPGHIIVFNELIAELLRFRKFDSALSWARKQCEVSPLDPDSHRNLGLCLRYLSRHIEAIAAFDAAIELDSTHHFSIFNKAESLQALERWNEAVACFCHARELAPQLFESHGLIDLAVCMSEAGQLESAIKVFDEAISREPNSAPLWYNRGFALAKTGNHIQALDSFERATSLDPDFRQAWLEKARTFMVRGDFESAAISLGRAFVYEPPDEISKQVSNNPDDRQLADLLYAEQLAGELLASAPESVSVLMVYAKSRYCTGWMPVVAEHCDQILSKAPDCLDALILKARALNRLGCMSGDEKVIKEIRRKALAASEQAVAKALDCQEALLQKVVALVGVGQFQEALEAFNKATLMSAASADDWGMVGMELGKSGYPAEALLAFERALRCNPKSVTALRGRAEALSDLKRFEEAKESIDSAIKLSPKDDRLFLRRGKLLLRRGDQREAYKDFAQALKLNQKNAEAHEGLALTTADTRKAERHFCRALEIDPERAISLRELGILEAIKNQFSSAEKRLRQALILSPKDIRIHGGLATVLMNTGRIEDAKIEFETAIALFPDPHIYHQYAELLSETGDVEKAKLYRDKAVEFFGENMAGHKFMIELLLKGGPTRGAIHHLKKLIELEPQNSDHLISCANLCSCLGLVMDAEKYFEVALNLEETSFDAHADYAEHLVKTAKADMAMNHFWRAWELRTQSVKTGVNPLVRLVELAFRIGYVHLMVIALSEALPDVRKHDDELYRQLEEKALKVAQYLEMKANDKAESLKVRSSLLCLAGVLSTARGELLEARVMFRQASQAPIDSRELTAPLNWATSLLNALESKTQDVSITEINEAVVILQETLSQCGTDKQRDPLAETLRRLESFQST
jgi:tetratricopeptide (TPR) repeat protein